MFRSALLVACVACVLCTALPAARAEEMDLALSRLRLASAHSPECGPMRGAVYCGDQELFERLMSELSVAMAPPVIGPARTIGARAFQLTFGTTVTSIEGGETYWRRGTEGNHGIESDDDDPETPVDESRHFLGVNESPQAALVWNHVQVRKGLPFGLEAAALLGQGMNTSLWTLGAALKWGLFEGFRTGLGQLPDVSLQAAATRSVGSSQATLYVYAFDLALSKPFVIRHTWSVSPLAGLQVLHAVADSGVVDLTPGGPGEPPEGDAFATCEPAPGHQETATVTCMRPAGTDTDFENDVVFEQVSNSRLRAFLGAEARYSMFTLAASLVFDVLVPDLDAHPATQHIESNSVAHQVAFSMSLGAVL